MAEIRLRIIDGENAPYWPDRWREEKDVVCYHVTSVDDSGMLGPVRYAADERDRAMRYAARAAVRAAFDGYRCSTVLVAIGLDGDVMLHCQETMLQWVAHDPALVAGADDIIVVEENPTLTLRNYQSGTLHRLDVERH